MDVQFELIQVFQRLSFCRDIDAIITVLREAARKVTGADGVTVVLREGDLCYYAEENAIAPLWKGRRLPMGTCISGWCMLHRQAVAIADIYADPRIPHDVYKPTFIKSLAIVPIRSEDPIGAIGAYWATHHRTSASELEVLQALGDSASMAFANVELIEKLKETNKRKDEFLSMLAHELRNPLAPIQNALYVLRARRHDSDTVAQMRDVAERQIEHMSRIVDDLLDVSRLASGKIALNPERLDFVRFVRQSAEDRRGVLEAAGLRLHLALPETPVWVTGDATRLTQVLGNVLDNARKFTPPGGQVTVRLTFDRDARSALVMIRDTGIGMGREMLPQVFEVFGQADRSLDRSRGGLGLGLSIAKNLLDLHAGTIRAESAGSGQGTEVTIRLPYDPESAAPATEAVTGTPVGKRVRILVVEDNREAARMMRVLLEIGGYDVMLAYTGPDGLEMAKTEHPAIVLCDIGLPGMDGYEVAAALRRNAETAATRLIAVTGYGREEDRRRALEAGFDAHLVKPVNPDVLLQYLST